MWRALRSLIAANPMGAFLWALITKWYLMIAVASLIVLYYVVKGLEQIGFIKYFTDTTVEILDTSKAVAQNCTPKLGPDWNGFVRFWNCLSNPGEYKIQNDTEEEQLQHSIDRLINRHPNPTIPEPATPVIVNPYEQEEQDDLNNPPSDNRGQENHGNSNN